MKTLKAVCLLAFGCAAWSCGSSSNDKSSGMEDPCVDACAEGEVRCHGSDAVERCAKMNSKSCLGWQKSDPCADGQVCSAGVCSVPCEDECATPPPAECLDATTMRSYSASGTCDAGTCAYSHM